MAIEFTCESCQNLVRTPDLSGGKRGRCPYCQAVVQIPTASTSSPAAAPLERSAVTAAAKLPAARAEAGKDTVSFACQACGKTARAPASQAGKKGRCPACQAVLEIPAPASKPTPQRQPSPSASPTPTTASTPAAPDFLLQPLSDFTPRRPAPSFPSPPLSTPGLEPLGGAPSGLTYLGPAAPQSPVGTLASTSPFAAGAPVYSSGPELDDPRKRRGFPWQKVQDSDAFFDTVKRVLFGFPTAFRVMRVESSVGPAMGFVVAAQVAATVMMSVYWLLLNFAIIVFTVGGNAEAFSYAMLYALIGFGLLVVVGTVTAVISAMLGSFVSAGISHLCLLIVGAANRGFETTYQVTCYCAGSCTMLTLVPIAGPLIAAFLAPIMLIFGFAHAHCTSGGRAAVAVLLPYLLCFGAMVFLVFSLAATILSQLTPRFP